VGERQGRLSSCEGSITGPGRMRCWLPRRGDLAPTAVGSTGLTLTRLVARFEPDTPLLKTPARASSVHGQRLRPLGAGS